MKELHQSATSSNHFVKPATLKNILFKMTTAEISDLQNQVEEAEKVHPGIMRQKTRKDKDKQVTIENMQVLTMTDAPKWRTMMS